MKVAELLPKELQCYKALCQIHIPVAADSVALQSDSPSVTRLTKHEPAPQLDWLNGVVGTGEITDGKSQVEPHFLHFSELHKYLEVTSFPLLTLW